MTVSSDIVTNDIVSSDTVSNDIVSSDTVSNDIITYWGELISHLPQGILHNSCVLNKVFKYQVSAVKQHSTEYKMNHYVVIVLILAGAVCLNAEPEPLLDLGIIESLDNVDVNVILKTALKDLFAIVQHLLQKVGLNVTKVIERVDQLLKPIVGSTGAKQILAGLLSNGDIADAISAVTAIFGQKVGLDLVQSIFEYIHCVLMTTVGMDMKQILNLIIEGNLLQSSLSCGTASLSVNVTASTG
ncbi:hypothetical protein Btru_013725 [Bulinus truncatus]|nr:hypothetical protein Btru_013725 [Bulinus truncatus]